MSAPPRTGAGQRHREAVLGAHRRLWDDLLCGIDPAERANRLREEMEHSPEDGYAMDLLRRLYIANLGRKPSVEQIEAADGGRARRAGVRASLWQDDDLTVTLGGRTLEWEAEGDNRAADKAYSTRTMCALMPVLREQIVWIEGTGGRAYGDSEYSESEYVTGEYGPRGGHDAGMTTAEFERRNRHLFHSISYRPSGPAPTMCGAVRCASTVSGMTEYIEMNTAELRRNLAATLDRVEAGERVMILRHEQPAAVLVPVGDDAADESGCDCPKWAVPPLLRSVAARVGLAD